jgi:hypothetical protein
MTLLPGVRGQIRAAAHQQARGRRPGPWARQRAGGPGRRWVSYLAPVVGLLVVLVVAAVVVASGGSSSSPGSAPARVVFRALPAPGSLTVSGTDVARAAVIMRERVGSVFRDSTVTVSGSTVVVVVHGGGAGARARILALSAAGRLAFYDWEANVLTPRGQAVASRLGNQDPTAVAISQGVDGAAPGDAGEGGATLYEAVKLAARQPARVSSDNSRRGSQYYLFGAPESAACATAARARGAAPTPGAHCLLSGPDGNRQDLLAGLPPGVAAAQGRELVVKPGTVVLQAADPDASHRTGFADPRARFYVLEDHASLSGNDITSPRQGVDAVGDRDVTFGFTPRGAGAFQRVTLALANRGALLSGLGQTRNQHFAVALDNKLLTVPFIDFKTYPSGISATNGADIAGGFTVQSAQDLATQLRYGALPVTLAPQ